MLIQSFDFLPQIFVLREPAARFFIQAMLNTVDNPISEIFQTLDTAKVRHDLFGRNGTNAPDAVGVVTAEEQSAVDQIFFPKF